MTSHNGGAKVAVIDPADALNRNGVNALLKTIEEPPPQSYVLLVAERPLALPATLRSRCQQLRFAIPAAPQARAWLAEGGVTAADLDAALDAAHGAPLQAQQLLQDQRLAVLTGWRGLLLELAAGRSEPLKAAAAVGEEEAAAFLRWLYGWLLDVLRAGLASGGAATEISALARSLPRRALDRYIAEVQDGLRRLESNAKAQLVLEAALIRWRGLVALGQRS